MVINNQNLYSEAYTILKNFINGNITDPTGRYKKQWIHPSMPNITDQKFDGYPFIVISVDLNETAQAFDKSTSNKVYRALVTIYSDQSTEVDSIADEILSKFKDETLTTNLNEFKSISVASSPFNYEIIGGRKIHKRAIGMIGVKRI